MKTLVATQKVNQTTNICQWEHIARQSHFTTVALCVVSWHLPTAAVLYVPYTSKPSPYDQEAYAEMSAHCSHGNSAIFSRRAAVCCTREASMHGKGLNVYDLSMWTVIEIRYRQYKMQLTLCWHVYMRDVISYGKRVQKTAIIFGQRLTPSRTTAVYAAAIWRFIM